MGFDLVFGFDLALGSWVVRLTFLLSICCCW